MAFWGKGGVVGHTEIFCIKNRSKINLLQRGAQGRGRTGTGISSHGILSPGRLPIPPLGLVLQHKILYYIEKLLSSFLVKKNGRFISFSNKVDFKQGNFMFF